MRPRTAVRGGVLVVLLLILGLLVGYLAISAWGRKRWAESSARFERETGALELRSWELQEVPVERNAATWIGKGAAALVLKKNASDPLTISNLSHKRPADWSGEEIAVIREAVALNRDGLAVLARARGLEDSTFGIRIRDGSTAKIPNLLEIVDAARLVFARGSLALRDGDRAEAISDALLLGGMARALQRERPLIVIFVGIAVERFQLRLVRAVIEDPALTPDELRAVAAGVLRDDVRADYSRALAAEAAVMCTEFRPLAGGVGKSRQNTVPLAVRFALAVAGDALSASCLDVFRETAVAIDAPVLTIAQRIEDARRRLQATWSTRLASDLAFPNLVNGTERAWLDLEMRRLTRAAGMLRQRGWSDGAYPADLAGLPADAAADPEGAGAWTYERRADGSARLAAPAAAALAEKVLYPGQAEESPLEWTLPAPR